MRLDGLLHQVWRDHPHYYRLDNEGRDWTAKARAACAILEQYDAIPQLDRVSLGIGRPRFHRRRMAVTVEG